MTMLPPDKLVSANLGDAKELSVLMPTNKWGFPFLLVPSGETVLAVSLGGEQKFACFDAKGNTAYRGLLITGVELVLDPDSAFDFSRLDGRPGVLVRDGAFLAMNLFPEGMMRIAQLVPLFAGLPAGSSGLQIGFNHWQVTIGQGVDRQVLFDMDLVPKVEE